MAEQTAEEIAEKITEPITENIAEKKAKETAAFDSKYDIVDEKTPRHTIMSGHYKQSFAYYTLRERLPVIITQIIDNLSKDKDAIAAENGEVARDEIKEIIGNLSKLKYQLQTDKPLVKFNGNQPDKEIWNTFIATLEVENNTFFKTCWLYAECYMYRRIQSFFERNKVLRHYDYFAKQKQNALTCCTDALEAVVKSTRNKEKLVGDECKDFFIRLLKLNLWGNRCDLSISEGKEIKQTGDLFSAIDDLDEYILADNTEEIWNCVSEPYENERIIDIVQDNAGYELFTDLLLADFLINQKLATKVRFHVKAMPWFISDVNASDFRWSLNHLSEQPSKHLRDIGIKWFEFLNDGQFILAEIEYFWTGPHEFHRMNEIRPKLHEKLSQAHLIIFKGDLNYRKLIGDYTWDSTESFQTCLRDFQPSNLCTLRTVKADLICGLKEGVAEKLDEEDSTWMTTGKYGVIQYCSKD